MNTFFPLEPSTLTGRDTIVVTGAGGLVGSYVWRALREAGRPVIAIFRQSLLPEERGVRSVQLNLAHRDSLSLLDGMGAGTFVHCAAEIPASFGGEEEAVKAAINRRMDSLALEACRRKGWRMIYLSSTSVYGHADLPWREDTCVSPVGAYAIAKSATEVNVAALEVPSVALRICAPYGYEQRTRTVLRAFIEQALRNEDLIYYGSGGREQVFTAAADVARAVVCTLLRPGSRGVFNVAGAEPVSMRDLANLVVRTLGSTSRVVASCRQDPQEEYRARVCIDKARELLGWEPIVSLEEGIRRWAAQLRAAL